MKILWKSSLSGLSDRLLDLFLVATISKISGRELYVLWQENQHITDFQLSVWPKSRLLDWKPEIFLQYFQLPKFITFVNQVEWDDINTTNEYEFSHYLGGVYSPQSFFNTYGNEFKEKLGLNITNADFMREFYKMMRQFKPTTQFSDLLEATPIPDFGIHLRRTDKVVADPDAGQIHEKELIFLNSITKIYLNSIIKINGDKNLSIYFCSDDPLERAKWEELYSNHSHLTIIKPPCFLKDYELNYFDLLMLSRCKTIVLSQRHSNFSLFASLINQTRLIFFYKNNPMNKEGHFKNMKLFTPNLFQKISLRFKLFT